MWARPAIGPPSDRHRTAIGPASDKAIGERYGHLQIGRPGHPHQGKAEPVWTPGGRRHDAPTPQPPWRL